MRDALARHDSLVVWAEGRAVTLDDAVTLALDRLAVVAESG